MFDRLLDLVGRDPEPVAASKAGAFRRFLLLLVAVESWEALHHWADRLVRDVLAGRAVDGVVVAVRRFELDRRTARIVTRDRVFRYDGDGRPLPESRSP